MIRVGKHRHAYLQHPTNTGAATKDYEVLVQDSVASQFPHINTGFHFALNTSKEYLQRNLKDPVLLQVHVEARQKTQLGSSGLGVALLHTIHVITIFGGRSP